MNPEQVPAEGELLLDPIFGKLKPPRLKINRALADNIDLLHPAEDVLMERSIVVSAMIDLNSRQEALQLKKGEIRHPTLGAMLEAIRSLSARGLDGFDFTHVVTELRATGFPMVAEAARVIKEELAPVTGDPPHVIRYYIDILRAYNLRNALMWESHLWTTKMHNDTATHIVEMAANHISNVNELLKPVVVGEATPEELARTIVESARNAAKNGDDAHMDVGIEAIDGLTRGIRKGQLVVLAARPSTGKSMLATTIAGNVCARGLNVLIFSFEVPKDDVARNIVCSRAMVDTLYAESGELGEQAMSRFENEAATFATYRIGVIDQPRLTAAVVRARTMLHKAKYGTPDLVIVDHLGKMGHMDPGDRNEVTQLGVTSGMLKDMAMDLGTRVLLLHQLNRGIEARVDKKPTLADLRGSGKVEEDADQVWMMFRPFKDGGGDPNEIHLFVEKNRRGRIGMRKLHSQFAYQRMTDPPIRL